MRGALDVHQQLLAAGVPHEIVRLPRPVQRADELPAVLSLPDSSCLTVRVFELARTNGDPGRTGPAAPMPRVAGMGAVAAIGHEGDMVAVLVTAGSTVDEIAVARACGGRAVRAAGPLEVNATTQFFAGLVSPVCLPTGLRLYAEASLDRPGVVYAATGEGGTALGIASRDLLRHVAARLGPFGLARQRRDPDLAGAR